MKRERGGRALERLRPRPGHGLGGQGRARARLLARLVGRRASGRSRRPATGRSQEREPTLFEIWVCADGYWCDHTKNLCPGELDRASTSGCSRSCSARLRRGGRPLPSRREPRRARPADPRRASPRRATPASRRTRSAHGVGARAHEPPYAHQAGGGDDRGGNGAGDRAGDLLGGRRRPAAGGQLPDHRGRRREALALPGRDRAA